MWVGVPSSRKSGSTRAYASLSPPTMIVSVPACTWGTLPDTGASSIAAPSARARSAISRLAAGLTVLMSAQIFPAARPARIPSAPEATASSTPSSGREVKTMSAASATSRGLSRHCRPSSMSAFA
jgi:hypothetical protein